MILLKLNDRYMSLLYSLSIFVYAEHFHDFKLGRIGIYSVFFLLRILCAFLLLILFLMVQGGKAYLFQILHYENDVYSSHVP